jgi:hypothetical protein
VWIIFATAPWMLIAGYVFAGLAVGADVPASWTLIAETAPARKRGRYGATIIFAHLLVVSLVLWALRRRMHESAMWEDAKARARLVDRTNQRRLFLSSVGLQIAALLLFALFPLTTLVARRPAARAPERRGARGPRRRSLTSSAGVRIPRAHRRASLWPRAIAMRIVSLRRGKGLRRDALLARRHPDRVRDRRAHAL